MGRRRARLGGAGARLPLLLCVLASCVFEGAPAAAAPWRAVLVTGASGRTGRIVVEKLVARGNYEVKALVRSDEGKKKVLRAVPGLPAGAVLVGDVMRPATLDQAMAGIFAVVIVTSAVPRIRLLSLVTALLGGLFRRRLRPKFRWKQDLKPEQVDWVGQRNQVDAALRAGAERIVLVGSMGGTQPDNFLNSIGEGGGDNILLWKRKAEMYLRDCCEGGATSYTIVHPGGLTDQRGGEREVLIGLDDQLLSRPVRSIPRSDVAEVCVQALDLAEAENRSFDVSCEPPGVGGPLAPDGLAKLLDSLGGRSNDYALNPPSA